MPVPTASIGGCSSPVTNAAIIEWIAPFAARNEDPPCEIRRTPAAASCSKDGSPGNTMTFSGSSTAATTASTVCEIDQSRQEEPVRTGILVGLGTGPDFVEGVLRRNGCTEEHIAARIDEHRHADVSAAARAARRRSACVATSNRTPGSPGRASSMLTPTTPVSMTAAIDASTASAVAPCPASRSKVTGTSTHWAMSVATVSATSNGSCSPSATPWSSATPKLVVPIAAAPAAAAINADVALQALASRSGRGWWWRSRKAVARSTCRLLTAMSTFVFMSSSLYLTYSKYVLILRVWETGKGDFERWRSSHFGPSRWWPPVVRSSRRRAGSSAPNGYGATSIDDIARDARVTKGAVYHHFETKDELFRSVYAEVEADAQARTGTCHTAHARRPSTSSSKVCTRTLTRPSTLRCSASRSSTHLLCSGPNPTVPRASSPATKRVREFVAEGIRAGAIRKLDADAIAHVLRGSILQGALVIAHSPDPTAARRRIGAVLEAMIRGLAPATRSRAASEHNQGRAHEGTPSPDLTRPSDRRSPFRQSRSLSVRCAGRPAALLKRATSMLLSMVGRGMRSHRLVPRCQSALGAWPAQQPRGHRRTRSSVHLRGCRQA